MCLGLRSRPLLRVDGGARNEPCLHRGGTTTQASWSKHKQRGLSETVGRDTPSSRGGSRSSTGLQARRKSTRAFDDPDSAPDSRPAGHPGASKTTTVRVAHSADQPHRPADKFLKLSPLFGIAPPANPMQCPRRLTVAHNPVCLCTLQAPILRLPPQCPCRTDLARDLDGICCRGRRTCRQPRFCGARSPSSS